jgi:hypothetical protein
MKVLKSIGAILAGMIFIGVTHSAVDRILEALGIFTPPTQRFDTPWMLVTATLYRTVLSIVGCFITGTLAPSRPMLHALILGVIGFVMSAIGTIVAIKYDLSPAWYPIALVALSIPCAWVGGRLAERRANNFS